MSTAKGNAFRDQVAVLLEAAGYRNIEIERLIAGKKVDVYGEREVGFSTQRLAIEAKDYTQTVPSKEVFEFVSEYGTLRKQGFIDQGVLVSRGSVSTQGMLQLDAARSDGLVGLTFQAFQRRVFGPNEYLRAVIQEQENEGLDEYYVPARIADGSLLDHVQAWMSQSDRKPLVVLGGYGTGKSTFALRLTADLARRSLDDPTARI